jgi:hypothetical protein
MNQKTIEEVKQLSKKTLLKLIERAKKYIKTNNVFKDMCQEYDVNINIIDIIPIKFGELEVSARTAKGIIILNYKLLCDGDFFKDYSYIIHEILHYFQQCYGDAATTGADDGDYLHNPCEQKGFQRQLEYIDDQFGKEEAEGYVEHLLDHHDKDGKEKEKLKDILMEKVEE